MSMDYEDKELMEDEEVEGDDVKPAGDDSDDENKEEEESM